MIKTLRLVLRLMRVQEEQRQAALKNARGELDRVAGVVGQLELYAREYRAQMVTQAQNGTTPAQLMETLEFERKLSQTAHGQKLIVGQLQHNVDRAAAQALAVHLRVDGLEKMLAKRKAELVRQHQQAEAREVEESIAARKVIGGMNTASDPPS